MTVSSPPFHHEALLYEGRSDLARRLVPFIREGVRAGEPVMAALTADKLDLLRDELGPDAEGVRFADMQEIGRNPATIIPAWRSWLDAHGAGHRPLRGIGEPIWADRTPSELVECQLHEALLNTALEGTDGFQLVCPYDTTTLDPAVLHEAHCTHPAVRDAGACRASHHYREPAAPLTPGDAPLARPPLDAAALAFSAVTLRDVRELVGGAAREAGLPDDRTRDLKVAVHELATNSIRHGGGMGVLRVWPEEGGVSAEVRDRGRITDPLAGRRNPAPGQVGGWGLWIANHTCDLVQVRSGPEETVIRVLVRG